jgi:hypothetical protein
MFVVINPSWVFGPFKSEAAAKLWISENCTKEEIESGRISIMPLNFPNNTYNQ